MEDLLDKDMEEIMKSVADEFKSISEYTFEIGVISENKNRKKTNKEGVTNAELMYIHENGSPLQHIPARPVLKMTIEENSEDILQKAVNKGINIFCKTVKKEDFEKELERAAIRIESSARKIIYSNDGRLVPNSPRVAKAKGGNHPLFDTGQLARSITCRVIKNN